MHPLDLNIRRRFGAYHGRVLIGAVLALAVLPAVWLGPSLRAALGLNAGYLALLRHPDAPEIARPFFEGARDTIPQAYSVSRALGVLALAKGETLAARVWFQRLADRGQADVLTHWNLGRALDAVGDRQAATMEYRLAGAAPYFYNAGMRLRHQKDWRGAEAALLRALEIAPQDASLAGAVAKFHAEWGRTDLARSMFRRALELEGRDYERALLYAELARLESDHAAAVHRLDEARRILPARPEAYRLLAESYLDTGDVESAIGALQLGAESAALTFSLNLRLAQLLIAERRWALAGQALERARAEDPNSDEGWLVTAQLEYEQGRNGSALQALEHALTLAPDNAETHFWLGRVYARQNQCELARLAYARAGALAPDDRRFASAQQVWESCR
jgi:tetratricopeptide (TPR) repeat protein